MQTKLFKTAKPKQDTNKLTITCINYLRLKGYHVWRNNNTGVWDAEKKIYRKNPYQLKGVSDIIGFNEKTGVFVACEIKVGYDKLSPEQGVFLALVNKAGGIGIEVRCIEDLIEGLTKK